jgi:hypothetical protein
MKLYSGTYGEPLRSGDKIAGYSELLPNGENYFGGVFASEDVETAEAHGDKIQVLEVDEIMDFYDLRHTVFYEDGGYEKAVAEVKRYINASDKDIEHLIDVALKETQADEQTADILGVNDQYEADWHCQGIAGVIALAFGAQAVYLPDEHGYSALVLPGAKILDPDD